jgi:polyisoprenoid-binding protein YceI
MTKKLALVCIALTALTACVEDVGKGKTAATVEEAPGVEAPDPTSGKALVTYSVDRSKSSVRALGAKVTATHPIDFPDYTASVSLDGEKVAAIAYEVQMATLTSDHPRLTEHLKNEDFFDVPKHPTSSFSSTSIAEGGEGEGVTHTVTGDLTIRGATKRVSFPATLTVDGSSVQAQAEFVIDRQDFAVTYPGQPDNLVQDNVVLTIAFVAPRG